MILLTASIFLGTFGLFNLFTEFLFNFDKWYLPIKSFTSFRIFKFFGVQAVEVRPNDPLNFLNVRYYISFFITDFVNLDCVVVFSLAKGLC